MKLRCLYCQLWQDFKNEQQAVEAGWLIVPVVFEVPTRYKVIRIDTDGFFCSPKHYELSKVGLNDN